MKRIFIGLGIFLLPFSAFASTLSVTPSSEPSGDEGSFVFTATHATNTAYWYIYNASGTNVYGNSDASHSAATVNWTDITNWTTGMASGTYTAGYYDNVGDTFSQATIDGACGVGKTYTDCVGTAQYIHTTTTVTEAIVPTASSTSEKVFVQIAFDHATGIVIGLFLGIAIVVMRKIKLN